MPIVTRSRARTHSATSETAQSEPLLIAPDATPAKSTRRSRKKLVTSAEQAVTDAVNISLQDIRPKKLKGSSYLKALYGCSATLHGLKRQSDVISSRLDLLCEKYHLDTSDFASRSLSENLATVASIPALQLHGKVGMNVKRETVEKLENILKTFDQIETAEEEIVANLNEEGAAMESELTAEIVHDTLEGIDRDLLGIDSQAALDKLSNLMNKTIEDNHPAKGVKINAAEICDETASIAESQPFALPKAPPFKFAFLSVVATYDAKCHVPLQDLHRKIRSANFDPQWFHSVVLTFPYSECRASIFENGKFVVTGVTTIKMALVATRNVLEIFQLCGYKPDINKRNFRAKNLTAMMDLGVNLDIAGFAEKYPGNTYLDQDTFGAVTHLPEKGTGTVHKGGLGMCFLVFATGKIVMVGGKTEKHMITVFRNQTLGQLKPFSFGYL